MFQNALRFGLLTAAAAAAAGVPAPGSPPAARAKVVQAPFAVVEVDTLLSMPPQFELVLRREMPTAGWRLEVDAVEPDPGSRRIRVVLTQTAPDGPVAQVLTPVDVRVPLGALAVGRHLVEVWTREGGGEPSLVQAEVVAASER